MRKWMALVGTTVVLIGAPVYAQESGGAGPGTIEASVIPGGAMFFTNSATEENFGNYNLGGALTYNINRFVGVEGELGGTLGITQSLAFNGVTANQKTPNTLNYSGNLVLSAPVHHGTVPYLTGGLGGLTMVQTAKLAIDNNANFLTGNVGGGVKWYANNRVGFRGDYRFMVVQSKTAAPAFFGQETRYGHRVYGGLILNVTK